MPFQSTISHLAWDLDNTLIERDETFRVIFRAWVTKHRPELSPETSLALVGRMMELDHSGEGDRVELCAYLLEQAGLPRDGAAALWDQMRTTMPTMLRHDPQIHDALERLARDFNMVMVTNGGSDFQRAKVECAGLGQFFAKDDCIVSGEIGADKPAPAIYHALLARTGVPAGQILFIGDHPVNDVAAPAQHGMRTCWVALGLSAAAWIFGGLDGATRARVAGAIGAPAGGFAMTRDMNQLVGTHDLVLLTLDTLRFDVAEELLRNGETPNFAQIFPQGWERRHSPGSFTYAAHQAFFAGFLPTPVTPPWPPRLFAAKFAGSETTGASTFVFEQADLPAGLRARGYYSICIGGVGFFNKLTPLSCMLPGMFDESHWSPEMGVTHPDSTQRQFDLATERLRELEPGRRVFLFINISALHQPNRHYVPGAERDSLETHAAALRYVDGQLPILLAALAARGPALVIACSDHGTLYGEEGFTGHRVGHPAVWTVPYAETILPMP